MKIDGWTVTHDGKQNWWSWQASKDGKTLTLDLPPDFARWGENDPEIRKMRLKIAIDASLWLESWIAAEVERVRARRETKCPTCGRPNYRLPEP